MFLHEIHRFLVSNSQFLLSDRATLKRRGRRLLICSWYLLNPDYQVTVGDDDKAAGYSTGRLYAWLHLLPGLFHSQHNRGSRWEESLARLPTEKPLNQHQHFPDFTPVFHHIYSTNTPPRKCSISVRISQNVITPTPTNAQLPRPYHLPANFSGSA